jgi:yecA family protein
MNWTAEEIIASLSYPGNHLPEDALNEAIKRYDEIRDELHAALKLSPDAVESIEADSEEDYMLQFFAMYLAAEKRDTAAFPLIRDFFAEYGEAASEIAGDMVCEHLDRILASICDDAEMLKDAANLPGLDTWARSAFLGALGILYHLGHLDRKQLVEWFRDWLGSDKLNQQERTSITYVCCALSLFELEQLLLDALRTGRIDPQSMRPEDITESMQLEQVSEYARERYALVDEAIDLLRLWFRDDAFDELDDLFEPEERMAFSLLLHEYNYEQEDEAIISPAFLHGYVFAVVLTPEPLSANEWLPHLFGGEMPPFDSIEDANAKLAVLMQFYNRLNQLRLEGQSHCPFDASAGTSPAWLDAIRDWCGGFVLGAGLRQEYWTQPDEDPNAEEVNAAMMAMLSIADDAVVKEIMHESDNAPGAEDESHEQSKFLAHAIVILPDAVRVLTEHTQAMDIARVAHMAPAHSNKVGRNAPCPCGSGKKFKKCCGAPGRAVH